MTRAQFTAKFGNIDFIDRKPPAVIRHAYKTLVMQASYGARVSVLIKASLQHRAILNSRRIDARLGVIIKFNVTPSSLDQTPEVDGSSLRLFIL